MWLNVSYISLACQNNHPELMENNSKTNKLEHLETIVLKD